MAAKDLQDKFSDMMYVYIDLVRTILDSQDEPCCKIEFDTEMIAEMHAEAVRIGKRNNKIDYLQMKRVGRKVIIHKKAAARSQRRARDDCAEVSVSWGNGDDAKEDF